MVHFILRSEDELPHGRRIVEDRSNDLVEWFQRHWLTRDTLVSTNPDRYIPENFDPLDWTDELCQLRSHVFGGSFYGLSEFFIKMLDRRCPVDLQEVRDFISSFDGRYSEGGISMVESAIQANTDDDEIDISWYLFDTDFDEAYPERTLFLRRSEVTLPTGTGDGVWTPVTQVKSISGVEMRNSIQSYFCFFSAQDGLTITEIEGCYALPTDMSNAAAWLASQGITAAVVESKYIKYISSDWPDEFTLLRAFLLLSKSGTLDEALHLFLESDKKVLGWLPRVFSDYRTSINEPKFLTGDAATCRKDLERMLKDSDGDDRNESGGKWEDKSTFQSSPHMTQAVFAEAGFSIYNPEEPVGTARQWIFFDSYWASKHPELAEGILRYGRGEDLLNK